jgi:SAM-dependent methyltransferase
LKTSAENTAISWFEGPLGARVLREETGLARLALDDVFGFELLQVGTWGPTRHLLEGARTQHTTLLAQELGPGVTLCAPLTSLPFPSDSIDAIFLPHTLELVEDPYAVLREAERVLCAEGCLLICGFNPWSGWGARRLFGRLLRSGGCATGLHCWTSRWRTSLDISGTCPWPDVCGSRIAGTIIGAAPLPPGATC